MLFHIARPPSPFVIDKAHRDVCSSSQTSAGGEGYQPDKYTFVRIVKACTSIGALDQGKQMRCFILEGGYELDVYVGSTLIDMYCKWHRLKDALTVWEIVLQSNITIWDVMLFGYALCRDFKEA
ncbi:hypothetical protein GOP47_0014356 [Adiantum capillus-veneris]|uniref:Pentatricopeptide repeat-containing protein n=1 Tax=Adiantum capillus-veneris TaxID=13818 RepID=A0A9D4ZC22_ADICA|nr:hypothetical protein GOP47_0014356 [Adiantum capillus-veneris]